MSLYSVDSGITKNTALTLCIKVEHGPNPDALTCLLNAKRFKLLK
jgi:hypothetical protein